MSIYEKNMTSIKKRDIELYRAICDWKEREESEFSIGTEITRNGMPVYYIWVDEKKKYLWSTYNPEHEAERFALKYIKTVDYAFLCFFGFGNGLVAKSLLKCLKEHITVTFYEPSAELFIRVLEDFDISEIMKKSRVQLIVKGLNDGCLDVKIAGRITKENYRISRIESIPLFDKLFSKDFEQFREKYEYSLKMVLMDIGTEISFGDAVTYNYIYNMRKIFVCNVEEEFEGKFPLDRPVIIVAAGPSLEKNVQYLKLAKKKMMIIGVDSALPYLISKGIYPDLGVVVDATKPVELFLDPKIKSIPLAAYAETNYRILEIMESKIIFFSSLIDYYNRMVQLEGKNLYHMATGGSVATSAFSLVMSWGYREIILVGQDLAIASNKVHAGNLPTNERLQEEYIEVEGYYGGTVNTLKDFDMFRNWYEVAIRTNEDLKVINATEGGAKIKGATQMSLRDAIGKYDVEPFDFEDVIKTMPPVLGDKHRKDILDMWENSIINIDILKEKLHEAMERIQQAVELVVNKEYKSEQIRQIKSELSMLIQECDSFAEISFLDEMVSETNADILGDIYIEKEDNAEEVCRMLDKLLGYIRTLHGSAENVKKMFQKIIEECGNEEMICRE